MEKKVLQTWIQVNANLTKENKQKRYDLQGSIKWEG